MNKLALAAIVGLVAVLACFVASGEIISGDDGDGSDSLVENSDVNDTSESSGVVKTFSGSLTIGGVTSSYTSFETAISEAKQLSDRTITFASNAFFNKTGKTISGDDWGYYDVSGLIIDLGGYTATIQSKMALILVGTEGFTIRNGTLNVVMQDSSQYISNDFPNPCTARFTCPIWAVCPGLSSAAIGGSDRAS